MVALSLARLQLPFDSHCSFLVEFCCVRERARTRENQFYIHFGDFTLKMCEEKAKQNEIVSNVILCLHAIVMINYGLKLIFGNSTRKVIFEIKKCRQKHKHIACCFIDWKFVWRVFSSLSHSLYLCLISHLFRAHFSVT